ncbi:hypothetical protein ACJX0J_017064, partial [Zea mays]
SDTSLFIYRRGDDTGCNQPLSKSHAVVAGEGSKDLFGWPVSCENSYSNGKKRKYHSDDLKVVVYLELLAKTDPHVLHHGVSKEVAEKFGVPCLVVQRIWRSGQDYGGI